MKTTKIALLIALGLAACTTEIGDIDRTQPNYVKKAIFQDGAEWYYAQTITDVGYTQGWANVGESGPLEKITWEIQQDFLLAYRAWEYIPGAEDQSQTAVRAPVAAFKILKHFDIRRGYNTVTGQENNVIGENDYDRPWWEREYMRVDWSTNYVDDLGINSYVWLQSMSPASYYVQGQEERDPNRAVIGEDYIDVSTKYLAEPDWETCYYMLQEHPEWCGGTTFVVRNSFRKIPKTDLPAYEPWNYVDSVPVPVDTNSDGKDDDVLRWSYDDEPCADLTAEAGDTGDTYANCYEVRVPIFERFGYFRNEKLTYDKQRGITMTGREFHINRWNIWEQSYSGRDATGKLIPLPYAQRTPKTQVWYTNVDFPAEMFSAAQAIADDWNQALLETVRALGVPANKIPARMFEVRRNDCNPDNVRAYVSRHSEMKEHLKFMGGIDALAKGNLEQVCAVLEYHSGEDDPSTPLVNEGVYADGPNKGRAKLVSEPFRWQKLGDIRYNQMVWQEKPVASSGYLGLAVMHSDPETGELVHANALVAGYYVNSLAARWLDYLDLIDGGITPDDAAAGEYITKAIYNRRIAREQRNRRAYGPATLQKLGGRLASLGRDRYVELPPGAADARLSKVKGSNLERKYLLTEEIRQAFSSDPTQRGVPLTEELAERASPARWASAEALKARRERQRVMGMGALKTRDQKVGDVVIPGRLVSAVYEPKEMIDDAIAGLALKWKDLPREEAIKRIRLEAYRAVGAHEVGHCMGLRHNFEASYDSLNWDEEWWHVDGLPEDLDAALALTDDQLALKNAAGEVVKPGAAYRQELQTCKAGIAGMPAGYSVTTQDCLENQKHMYSSIMDYHRKMNSDWSGLGKYDYAAIKFGYGQLVEVFDEGQGKFVPRDNDVDDYFGPFGRFDYREIPKVLAGVPKLVDGVEDYPYDYGKMLDDELTRVRAAAPRRENLQKRKLITLAEAMAQVREKYKKTNKVERRTYGDVPVPYLFCPDDFADWRLTCQTFDLGGNMREVIANVIDDYHLYYPFRNFKRDRFGWGGINAYMQSMYERTFFPLTNMFRYFFYYSDFFQYAPMAEYEMTKDWTTGATVGLNFIAEILQTPEPGKYCKQGGQYVYSKNGDCRGAPEFTIPFIVGKYYDNAFTDEYVYKMGRIGVIYDKLIAIQALTDSEAFFYRDAGSYTDRRRWSISYYRLFREEMIKLFESLILGEGRAVAGRIVQDKDAGGAPIAGTEHFMPNLVVEEPSSVDYVEVAPLSPSGAYSYTMRYYALLFGLAKMTSTVDSRLDFDKYLKVALAGTPEDVSYGRTDETAWTGEGGTATNCNVVSECAGFRFADSVDHVKAALVAKGLNPAGALNAPAGPVQNDVYLWIERYNTQTGDTLPAERYLITGVSGSGSTVDLTLRTTFAAGENTLGYSTTPLRPFAANEEVTFRIQVVRGGTLVSFIDPLSRYRYNASTMDNGLGIGAHLIQRANQLAIEYQTAKTAYDAASMEDKATLFAAYEQARARLAEQQELIDLVREFHGYFEYGG